MVKKEREFPLRLKLEDALLRSLHFNNWKRKKIEVSRSKNLAGYNGEKELDYHLNFLPEKEFYIFQNLCLPKFQLDVFILCSKFGVIVESKNFSGTLIFQNGFSRLLDGKKNGFPDPLLQVKRQQLLLTKWLIAHNIKPIPVFVFVAISSPSTLIEPPFPQNIYHAERIPSKILELQRTCSDQNLSLYQLNKITDLLLQHHQLPKIDILQVYDLHPKDFILGIPCPQCKYSPMVRIHNSWQCQSCKDKSPLAHNQFILDHLLIHGKVSNQQCQQLLQLAAPHTVKRILQNMNLPYKGTGKNRIYFFPK